MQFLRAFDQFSFWMGFLAASLFWWVFSRLTPLLKTGWQNFQQALATAREERRADLETKYRASLLQSAQKLHLAAPLFTLEEILIPPRVLAPPSFVDPQEDDEPPAEIVNRILPYMPDWPELATAFGAPALSLAEALQDGAHLALTAPPGTGKTVALAHLAILCARHSPEALQAAGKLPILVHAADLPLQNFKPDAPLEPLLALLTRQAERQVAPTLPTILEAAFIQKRALLLFDGLDELDRAPLEEAVQYLAALLQAFPGTQIVAAVSPEYYDGLTALGFTHVIPAAWDRVQRKTFSERWAEMWATHVSPILWSGTPENALHPFILTRWLQLDTASFTPCEVTLKTWAAFAGDTRGPLTGHAFEAYLHRMTTGIPKAMPALERLAHQMVLETDLFPPEKIARGWVKDPTEISEAEDLHPESPELEKKGKKERAPTVRKQVLNQLVDAGVLQARGEGQVGFSHAVLAGYLAGKALSEFGGTGNVARQLPWAGKSLALQFLATFLDVSAVIHNIYTEDNPLQQGLMGTARWLRTAPKDARWRVEIMRRLANLLQQPATAYSTRTRALAALVTSGDPGVLTLCRKFLDSQDAVVRKLSILGLGFLQDVKSVPVLAGLLEDGEAEVRTAACLALAALGTRAAIDAVATALLHGDEELQRAAAESLAHDPADGHTILKEAAALDDLLVRRASVFGLARVQAGWAHQILTKMQVQDGQWVVRNAAAEAVRQREAGSPYTPKRVPPASQATWLIKFAGERGEGVSPGKSAHEMLHKALEFGTEAQKLAAIHYLVFEPEISVNPAFYDLLFGKSGKIQDEVVNALCHLAATGMKLASPAQFGRG